MLKLEKAQVRKGDFLLSADFSLDEGTRTAIIGPSGGGKSTLLALIAGFLLPDAGRVSWQGCDLLALPPGARPVAMLFQDGNLFPHLDLVTNVALGISPLARPTDAAFAQATEALGKVGLSGFEMRRPGDLSGGQQSRAALARTLVTARPVVLLDEPFSALGPAMRHEMLDLVRELLPAATILMVTHDPEDARAFAPQTLFIDNGNIDGPHDTGPLLDSPNTAVARYLR